jgi:hypothetical protein
MILSNPFNKVFSKPSFDLMHFLGKCFPLSAAACVSVLLASITPASAQLVIFGEEVGPDVVFTVSGSFDPGAPTPGNDFSPETIFDPSGGHFEAWQTATIVNRFALDATVLFGAGVLQENVGIGAGDNFAIFGDELSLHNTYVAGTPINTTLTFAGTTLAALGVDVAGGPHVWTVTDSGGTITMLFTLPAPKVDNSALRTSLSKKIKKLKKEARLANRKGQSAKAKRLLKKAMKCQKTLKALG